MEIRALGPVFHPPAAAALRAVLHPHPFCFLPISEPIVPTEATVSGVHEQVSAVVSLVPLANQSGETACASEMIYVTP